MYCIANNYQFVRIIDFDNNTYTDLYYSIINSYTYDFINDKLYWKNKI